MNDFYLMKRHHDRQRELEGEADNERLIREALAHRRKLKKMSTRRLVISYRFILAWMGRRLIVIGARLHTRYGEVWDSAALAAVLDLHWQEHTHTREQSL